MDVTCHCGNVEISVNDLPQEVGECNCSICRRYAALWAYYSPELVTLKHTKEETVLYIWGDREVEFHRCNVCGCLTHYITTEKCDEAILAINMRMADAKMLANIPVRKINGAGY